MYSSFQSYTPSKRLSSILSQYLDFDENQLHLGLWSGDLQLQNVKIKREALGPILNSWKTHGQDTRTHSDSTTASCANSTSTVPSQDRDPCSLLIETLSWEDAVNVVLVQGTVGSLRVRVSWQKLLLGKSDTVVDITLTDVLIVLRVESDRLSPAHSIPLNHSSEESIFQNVLRSTIIASILKDSTSSVSFSRADKQQQILEAEFNHSKRRDIPHFEHVVPKDFMLNHCFRKRNSDEENVDEREERRHLFLGDSDKNTPSSTWIERITRSLASSLGWRMAKALQTTVLNLRIVLVQEDMEVGVTNKCLEIKDSSLSRNNQEDSASHPSSMENDATPVLTKSDTVSSMIDSGGLLKTQTSLESTETRKSVHINGLGIYIRNISPTLIKRRYDDVISIDDYVLRPTHITIRCGIANQLTPSEPCEDTTDTLQDNKSSCDESSHEAQSVSSERVRRGKREKRRKLDINTTDESRCCEQGFVRPVDAEFESVATRHRMDSSISQNEFNVKQSTNIDENSSSKSIAFDINIPSLQMICSSQHYQLGHSILCSLARTKNGKPDNPLSNALGDKGLLRSLSTSSPSKQKNLLYRSTLRAWWKYAILNVLRDLRREKLLQAIQRKCSMKTLSPIHSSVIRKEYIALFVRLRLKNLIEKPLELDESEIESRLFLLEDLLHVEQILLFRSIARKIATNRSSILKTIVFGNVDNSPTTPGIPLPLNRNDSSGNNLYQSVANREYREELVRHSKQSLSSFSQRRSLYNDHVDAEENETRKISDPKSVNVRVSFSLNEASFVLLSFTGITPVYSDLSCENDSNDDVSVLTMGSFGVSSYSHDASECRLANFEHSRFDRRADIFAHKNHVLFSTSVGQMNFEFSSRPDKVYLLTIQSVMGCYGDAEILSFQPMNSNCESRALGLRQMPGFFHCIITRSHNSGISEAAVTVKASLARLVLNLNVEWLLKLVQFFGDKGLSKFPCPTIRLSSLEPSNINEALIDLPMRRMRDKSLLCTFSSHGLDLKVTMPLKEKRIGDKEQKNSQPFHLVWHISTRHVSFSEGRKTVLREPHFLLHLFASAVKTNMEQHFNDLSLYYESHRCIKIISLYQRILYKNLLRDDLLYSPIEPIDVVILHSSNPNVSHIDRDMYSLIISALDLKMCHRGIQAMDSLFNCLMNDFVRIVFPAHSNEGNTLHDPKGLSFRTHHHPFKFIVPKVNIRIENELKEGGHETGNYQWEEELLQQILMEYLSLVACFQQAPTNIESSHLARTACVERIRSLGLSLGDAITLTTTTKKTFFEELELVEKSWSSQRKLLIQLATESSSFSVDSPRERFANTLEADKNKRKYRSGRRRSQSDSNLSWFGLSPEDESSESWNEYENNFVILEETIALSVRQAIRSRRHFFSPVRDSLDILFSGGFVLSKVCDGCFDSYQGTISTLSIRSKASSIVQLHNLEVSWQMDFVLGQLKMTASVDTFDTSFSSLYALDIIELMSPLVSYLTHFELESGSSVASSELSRYVFHIRIASLSLLFSSDHTLPQPFMKCSFSSLTLDILRESNSSSAERTFRVESTSDQVICKDLTPEGLWYPGIMESLNQVLSFDFRFNWSSLPSVSPSEVIVTFHGVRVFVCRRIISEIIQYLTSPDYGIGRLLYIYATPTELKASFPSHPIMFELRFVQSSLLFPKESQSYDGLVAVKTSYIRVFRSLHLESWSLPRVYSFDKAATMTQDAMAKSSDGDIKRMNVIISDLDVFVASENPRLPMKVNTPYSLNFQRNIHHDALLFENTVPDTASLSSVPLPMLTRRWQRVTMNPFDLNLMIDYAPHLRLCIMDTMDSDHDVCFEMKMSHLYTLLSLYYNNMQELPRMFHYSKEYIESGATYPDTPGNWPEYDSELFFQRLKLSNSIPKIEIALSFKKVDFKCTFDSSLYFLEPLRCEHMLDSDRQGILVQALDLVVIILSDEDGLMRISCGATNFSLIDLREGKSEFTKNFGFRVNGNGSFNQAIDTTWGVSLSDYPLPEEQYLPFCASVFLTPDRWCQINLGLENLDVSTADLAPVWMALEYFGSYFRSEAFGHPFFIFDGMRKRTTKSSLGSKSNYKHNYDDNLGDDECLNIDFRLCVMRPHFAIPTDRRNLNEPFLVLESDCLFYRYRGVGYFFSSQDIYCTSLDVTIVRDYNSPSLNRAMRDYSGSNSGIRNLIDSANIVLEYSYHSKTKHTDVRLSLPTDLVPAERNKGLREMNLAKPIVLAPSHICRSIVLPSRQVNNRFCNIHVSLEALMIASSLMIDFIGPYDKGCTESAEKTVPYSFVLCLRISCVRLFFSDDELGMHLPFYSVSIPTIRSTISQIPSLSMTELNSYQQGTDLQVLVDVQLWVDYFKLGPTRSFEPLLEPYSCIISMEKSLRRGYGFDIRSECPLHMNLTSAMLESLDTAISNFRRSWLFLYEKNSATKVSTSTAPFLKSSSLLISVPVRSYCAENRGKDIEIMHLFDNQSLEGKVSPFLLVNLCGLKVRFCQRTSESKLLIHYLAHGDSSSLQMPATRSIVRNLKVTEVPWSESSQRSNELVEARHTLDLQIPGFSWIQLPIDTVGTRFVDLIPKSSVVTNKLHDWRLKNLLKLITDIHIVEGGRHISVFSTIEIVNRTRHKIEIASHVDPNETPPVFRDWIHRESIQCKDKANGFIYEDVSPDKTFHVPLFLLESALHLKGNNLGSLWIRPHVDDSAIQLMLRGSCTDSARHIGFCSNPFNLSRLVLESSFLLSQERYIDEGEEGPTLNTGLDLSCPIYNDGPFSSQFCVSDRKDDSRAIREKRDRFEQNPLCLPSFSTTSQFCYCMEIRRKVVDRSFTGTQTLKSKHSFDDLRVVPEIFRKKRKNETDILASEREDSHITHGPIAYSLVLHPPLTIENLLPERGRFELMHATRRQVLWFGDLAPGESVPIHTVGLDAPLLLLLNMGYCRTPFGQGILVHEGCNRSSTPNFRPFTEVKSIKPPEKNGYRNNHLLTDFSPESKATGPAFDDDDDEESLVYSEDDLVSETIVVDSLGQKLNLMVSNERGSGGQRHIAVWCPFWILNSTEHALLYKQERSSTFVSGTVHSTTQDGSRQVDGSLRVRGLKDGELDTIFPGRPGVLASSPGNCMLKPEEIVGLLDEHIPLQKASATAFMFNFEKIALGQQRLCVQLMDTSGKTRYTSDWSSGFSLDSVGITQTIGMHCADGRLLEVTVKISIPPGLLGKFTKIVRFSPRYIIINQLAYPIRVWQDSSLMHPARHSERYRNEDESSTWHVDRYGNIDGVIYQYEPLFGGSIALDYRAGTKEILKGRTSAHRSALYIVSLGPKDVVPFHLPDTRQDREIRVDIGSRFNLTASFPVDVIGADYVLKVTEVEDVRMFDHVDTRAAPCYTVQLPPADELETWDGDLGLWLESIQWDGERKIIVKGIKRGKYSYNSTDVRVGDELLKVNDISVTDHSFTDVMKIIKDNLDETFEAYKNRNSEPLSRVASRPKFLRRFDNIQMSTRINISIACVTFTFNTLEDRINQLRQKGLRSRFPRGHRKSVRSSVNNPLESMGSISRKRVKSSKVEREGQVYGKTRLINANIKLLNQSICVFIQPFVGTSTPYRIDNRSINFTVHYRQHRCDEHDWFSLAPGESSMYCWDEPTKDPKLSVRIGNPIVSSNKKPRQSHGFLRTVKSEEYGAFGPICVVKLDEIGFEDFIQSPSKQGKSAQTIYDLYCRVDTDGSTRVLIISEVKALEDSGELVQIERHLSTLSNRIDDDNTKLVQLKYLNSLILNGHVGSYLSHLDDACVNQPISSSMQSFYSSSVSCDGRNTDIIETLSHHGALQLEQELKRFIQFPDDFCITRTNQLSVEVLEAKDLPTWDSSQLLSPYAVVKFNYYIPKGERSLRSFGRARRSIKRPTYYVKKTSTPKWSGQSFIFDVPSKAVQSTHGYSVVVKIKNHFDFGNDATIGYTEIHLSSLRGEKELFGWHPLMFKATKGTDFSSSSDGAARGGSVLLRLQWVHSLPALFDYYILTMERRLIEIENYREGMRHHADKVRLALEMKPRFIDLHSLAELPPRIMQRSVGGRRDLISPKGLEDVQRNWAVSLSQSMRSARLQHIWSRSMHNRVEKERPDELKIEETNLFEDKNIASPVIDRVSSNQEVGLDTANSLSLSSSHDTTDAMFLQAYYYSHQKTGRPRSLTSANPDYSDDYGSSRSTGSMSTKIGSWSHRYHLNYSSSSASPLSIHNNRSWIAAMMYYNDPLLASQRCLKKKTQVTSDIDRAKGALLNELYPSLLLPPRAAAPWQSINNDFISLLHKSRVIFGETAQKTLMTMLNPGGTLTLRPIMAHNVPDSFTGMYVKVKYGDETKRTQTVNAKATPKWTNDFLDTHDDQNSFHSFEGDPLETKDNDLEVHVPPLKTVGSLRLSVVGVKANTKVEIGAVHIPLSNAIEATYHDTHKIKSSKRIYVRWFPLKNPKDCIPLEGDLGLSTNSEPERMDPNRFTNFYTPSIKIAIWWEPLVFSDDLMPDKIGSNGSSPPSEQIAETYMHLSLNSFSLAMIDSTKAKELASFCANNLDLSFSSTKASSRLNVTVGWIQLDNPDEHALVPVILSPTATKNPQPTLHLLALKDNLRSKMIHSFKLMALDVEELDLRVEESWMFFVWEFFLKLFKHKKNTVDQKQCCEEYQPSDYVPIPNEFLQVNSVSPASELQIFFKEPEANSSIASMKKVYVEKLMLGSLKVNVSYMKSSSPDARKRNFSEYEKGPDTYRNLHVAHTLPNIILSIIPSITNAPITVGGKVIDNVFEFWDEIFVSLQNYYVKEVLHQVYKVVGSLDFVGNPTMVLNSFMKGARDFVVQPLREFLRSPDRIGIGVAKGTLSLVSHFFAGVFGFLTNISIAGGNAAATFSLDERFQRWHKKQLEDHARHVHSQYRRSGLALIASAISRPLQDILLGVAFAATGIFVEPYYGARLRGKVGFVSGVAVGALGIVTKPLVGIFDAFAHASETVHDAARLLNVEEKKLIVRVRRIRLPYIFGLQNILLPYDTIDCRSMSLLHRLDMWKGKGDYDMVPHEPTNEVLIVSEVLRMAPGLDTYVIVTNIRVVIIRVKNENAQPQVLWQVHFQSELEILSNLENRGHNGIVLRITSHKPMSLIERNDSMFSIQEEMSDMCVSDIDGTDADQAALEVKPSEASSLRNKSVHRSYKLVGDFMQRAQLTRIHNAICCLSQNYSSVIRDDGASGDTSFVHFKHMMFDGRFEAHMNEGIIEIDLDQIIWLDQERDRYNWTLADEELLSRRQGGPEWLIKARARNMFTPLSVAPTSIPLTLDLDNPAVIQIMRKLKRGLISVTQANEELMSLSLAMKTEKGLDKNEQPGGALVLSPLSSDADETLAIVPYHETTLVPIEDQTKSEIPGAAVVAFLKRKLKS